MYYYFRPWTLENDECIGGLDPWVHFAHYLIHFVTPSAQVVELTLESEHLRLSKRTNV